jgi:signal transduction histidine kinase
MNKIYPILFFKQCRLLEKIIIFSLIFFCFKVDLSAQKPIILIQNQQKYDLGNGNVAFYEDVSSKLTFEEVQQKKFIIHSLKSFNQGYSVSKFWFRVELENRSTRKWIFVIVGTLIDDIEFFEKSSYGTFIKRVSGDNLPHSSREIHSPLFTFYLNVPQNEIRTIYFSIKSKDTKQFSLNIEDDEYFKTTLTNDMIKWFFYFGMLFMMFVYNLLLYFSIRDLSYLFYVFYIASFGLLQFTMFGYGTEFIWGENIWFTQRASAVFVGLTNIFIALFSYKLLNIKVFYPKLKIVFLYIVVCGGLMVFISLINPTSNTNYFTAVFSLFNVSVMYAVGVIVVRKGYVPARFYIIAWGILFFSIAIYILNISRILPNQYISYLTMPIGGIIEITLLSFSLGNRINTIEKDKTNAQQEVILQLQTNESVRKRIARDLHDDLGSTLSSIRILSEFAHNETFAHPEKVPNLLNKIKNSTQKLQENLQDIIWTTQSKDNSVDELMVKIRRFGGEVLEAKNIDYRLKINKNLNTITLPANVQYDIFMIFKEAINNIVKYSKAKNVFVNMYLLDNLIILNIKDDGIGFDILQDRDGNGLKNMPERAKNINGTIEISSKTNEGTNIQLIVHVPI